MKNKKQPTHDEVIERGEYLGFKEYESGAVEQRWLLDGIVYTRITSTNGRHELWRCMGKASKVLK